MHTKQDAENVGIPLDKLNPPCYIDNMNEQEIFLALRKALEFRWACSLKNLSDKDVLDSVISELVDEVDDPIVQEMLKYRRPNEE